MEDGFERDKSRAEAINVSFSFLGLTMFLYI